MPFYTIPTTKEQVENMRTEQLWYLWKDYENGDVSLSEEISLCVASEMTLRGL